MNPSPTALTCPKCGAEMRSYERNRVLIDQCVGCRGVFLDRGELESLIDAERSFYAVSPTPVHGAVQPQGHGYDQRDSDHGGHGSRRGRKRGGFLGDLFD